jgi:hypothetical protein
MAMFGFAGLFQAFATEPATTNAHAEPQRYYSSQATCNRNCRKLINLRQKARVIKKSR